MMTTVARPDLPSGPANSLRSGTFEKCRNRHADAWPEVLAQLDDCMAAAGDHDRDQLAVLKPSTTRAHRSGSLLYGA